MRRMHALALLAAFTSVPLTSLFAQRSHRASPGDKTGQYIIDMERSGNGPRASASTMESSRVFLLRVQGTSTTGHHFTKSDELRDEKAPRSAHDCGLDTATVRFFGDRLAIVYGSEHAVGKDKAQPNIRVRRSGLTHG